MGTTINSAAAIIAKTLASAPKRLEAPKTQTAEREQHTEAFSSTYSSAARSVALAGITMKAPTEAKPKEVNYTEGINCDVIENTTGDAANKWWLEEMNYENPPYLPKSKVQHIELKEDTMFCRVYDGDVSGMLGGWLMKPSDIEGLTPEEIQDKFALPAKPVKMCDVMVPKGTQLRTGLCNPLEGWGKGGGTQFDLMGKRIDADNYTNERDLPT